VIVAEDDVLTREGITGLITRFGHQVVAAVGDADALIDAVREHQPDIVITDVRMPPSFTDEGLQAATRLRRADPDLPILVVSQYVEQTYATELLESARPGTAGIGYLLKDRIGDVIEFIDALDRVADGHTVVDTEVVRQLLSRRRDPIAPPHAARTRSARPDGRGKVQRRDRPHPVRHRSSGRQTHQRPARQAGPAPGRGRPPKGPRRACLPERLI
jgi:DNA-binding NarL/FixJ family response regulator